MPVGGLKGTGAPKIELKTASSVIHTITFSSWVKQFNPLDTTWDPEYDVENARMSDSGRTIKQYLAGFRFRLTMGIDDEQLATKPTETTYREYFEYLMDLLSGWNLAGVTNSIVVYPYEDNTAIYYTCVVETSAKNNAVKAGLPRTVTHQHTLTLVATTIATAIPQQSTLPWV